MVVVYWRGSILKSRNSCRIIISLAAATLFGVGAIRFFLRSDTGDAIVYCVAAVIFLLIAYGQFKGVIK